MNRAMCILLALAVGIVAGAEPAKQRPGVAVVAPRARVQTVPVPHGGDAADDPAIWIHPTEPAKSLILGTDKQGGLHAYDLDGRQHQLVGDGSRPNNVDVLYGFRLADGAVDLAVASVRGRPTPGIKVWRIDPATRTLHDVTAGDVRRVCAGSTPYGCCTYRSARTRQSYFFVSDRTTGRVEQWRLADAGGGKVGAVKVRTLRFSSTVEGMVADDEFGQLFVGEEAVGIWKLDAEPDGGDKPVPIAKVGQHGFRGEVEGLTIYDMPADAGKPGRGYLIAADQGAGTFRVYDRRGDHRLLAIIDPAAGEIDDVSDTDGIAVTSRATSPRLPHGFLVVQDGHNARGNQNFKLYAWEDIRGERPFGFADGSSIIVP
jgi:3-phytase